jgi:hypothetical protein
VGDGDAVRPLQLALELGDGGRVAEAVEHHVGAGLR